MTAVFIENVLGSGQVIIVLEEVRGRVTQRELKPGENARIAVNRFKSVMVKETAAAVSAFELDFGARARRVA